MTSGRERAPGQADPRAATDASVVDAWSQITAVCAHPDDETFGLGGIIAALVEAGTGVRLVCLTCGESSTLGAGDDLAGRRRHELTDAATALGIDEVTIKEHPDGALEQVPLDALVADIVANAGGADALLTFDDGGITGHPDHQRATDAAVAAGRRLGVPVFGWALPEAVAATMHAEFGAPFVGRSDAELDLVLTVDRTRQQAAMACHHSQLTDNPVPQRRIDLQGDVEHLRELYRP